MLTPGACARLPLRFPGAGGGVGVGVGLLVCLLMPDLRVAGADTLSCQWAELEAEWPYKWCSRLVWVSVQQNCWVGVGAGLVRESSLVLVFFFFFFFWESSFITHSMQRRPALARRPPQGPWCWCPSVVAPCDPVAYLLRIPPCWVERPRLYDSAMVTQITLKTEGPHGLPSDRLPAEVDPLPLWRGLVSS